MAEKFIFASCKSWHRPLYEDVSESNQEIWKYASSPDELKDAITDFSPKYIFFLHWNWFVPESVWSKFECVCFHMTDVPYGRGGSPLQNLILAGHKKTQLTALRMVKEMDAGPVYKKITLSLDGPAEDIYLRAGRLSTEIIKWMIINEPVPIPQVGKPSLFSRRKPEQSKLPELGDLSKVYDFIRMLDAEGYPHSFVEHGELILKFRKANLYSDKVIAEVEIKLKNE